MLIHFTPIVRELLAEIGNLHNLQVLGLRNNKLNGTIPVEFFNISALQILNMYRNQLSGSLLSDLGIGMPNLEEVYLRLNDLRG